MMKIICAMLLFGAIFSALVTAEISNVKLTVVGEMNYSDIWLGVSTGGYDLLAERGNAFTFRVFIKNGMNNRSLNNVQILAQDLPFKINSITPKTIEQLKPMEIRIYWVNMTIPGDSQIGKYPLKFDVQSDEFPRGVFGLNAEVKVVDRIKTELYIFYALIILAVLGILFYRKIKLYKQ